MKKFFLVIFISLFTITVLLFVFWRLMSGNELSDGSLGEKDNYTEHTDSDENGDDGSSAPKLIFIHHSTGENWLSDSDGRLGIALRDEGYFVSDTNYGWGPDNIGDLTDIGHWWLWFRGSDSDRYIRALYLEDNQNSEYSRLNLKTGGENEIIVFKSCFPNSNFLGNSSSPIPEINDNPLKGEDSSSEYHTVANAKGIYIDLLQYFETRQDKLFIVVTAPPLGRNNTESWNADNARYFNNWLVNNWLSDYDYNNVAVFDFYDVLTDHGKSNYAEFTVDEWDDHPSTKGNRKATEEFILFLNQAYEKWKD